MLTILKIEYTIYNIHISNRRSFMGDNIDFEKEADLEDIVENEEAEGIAMELLRDFKEHNKRTDEYNKRLISIVKALSISFALAVTAIVAAFLIYLYQYDFQSYSQDGNGYNNINTGEQGDVYNGTAIPSTEEEGR